MPEQFSLWPDHDDGTLTVCLCEQPAPRGAVLVFPGGGYRHLAQGHEGMDTVAALNAAGFDAAMLCYRLGPAHRHPAMIRDACRGMRVFRAALDRAGRLGPCAALGYSAGGHLAGTLAVHADGFPDERDDLRDRYAADADAVVLCYPVVDMAGPATHGGSRRNLLGQTPDPTLLEQLSLQRQVRADTPPTFIWHTVADASVPVTHSIDYARACIEHGVPVELHCYETGPHGLGLAEDHPARTWFALAVDFLGRHLPHAPATATTAATATATTAAVTSKADPTPRPADA